MTRPLSKTCRVPLPAVVRTRARDLMRAPYRLLAPAVGCLVISRWPVAYPMAQASASG